MNSLLIETRFLANPLWPSKTSTLSCLPTCDVGHAPAKISRRRTPSLQALHSARFHTPKKPSGSCPSKPPHIALGFLHKDTTKVLHRQSHASFAAPAWDHCIGSPFAGRSPSISGPRKQLQQETSPAATMAAVSVRCTPGPRLAGTKPALVAKASSSSSNPPSGPTSSTNSREEAVPRTAGNGLTPAAIDRMIVPTRPA